MLFYDIVPSPHLYRPLTLYYPVHPPPAGIGELQGQGNHNLMNVLPYGAFEEVLRNVKGTRRMYVQE